MTNTINTMNIKTKHFPQPQVIAFFVWFIRHAQLNRSFNLSEKYRGKISI